MTENMAERFGRLMGLGRIPLPVLLVACLYLLVGIGGSVAHFSERGEPEWIWIELTETVAVVCGIFLLRGKNWARWLAGAWMAFHVALSYGDMGQMAIHAAFFVVIVWCLFRADSSRFFRHAPGADA